MKNHSKETLIALSGMLCLLTQTSGSKLIFVETQTFSACLDWRIKEPYTITYTVIYILNNERKMFYCNFTGRFILSENSYSILDEWIVNIIRNHSKYFHCSFSSWMSRRKAKEDAERRMREGRRNHVWAGDDNTVPAPPTHQWSSKGSFSKENLFSLITRVPPSTFRRIGRDCSEMNHFLDVVRRHEDEVPVLTGSPYDSFNPIGVLLLGYPKRTGGATFFHRLPHLAPEKDAAVLGHEEGGTGQSYPK